MPVEKGSKAYKVIDNARQQYVSYLTTDEIAACMARIQEHLLTLSQHEDVNTRRMYLDILGDLQVELTGRQLGLF
jgi:hypothetical protein